MENQKNSDILASIRESVWNGKFLVKLEVPEHYISVSDQPKPIYVHPESTLILYSLTIEINRKE